MRWLLAKDLRILARSPLLGCDARDLPDRDRRAGRLRRDERAEQAAGRAPQRGPAVGEPDRPGRHPGGRGAGAARPLFDAIEPVHVETAQQAIDKVRSGDVLGALIIPPDITQSLEAATAGGGKRARVEVFYNAEDPAKQSFVENTIKARVQDANAALAKRFTQVAASYIKLLSTGGSSRSSAGASTCSGCEERGDPEAGGHQVPKGSPARARARAGGRLRPRCPAEPRAGHQRSERGGHPDPGGHDDRQGRQDAARRVRRRHRRDRDADVRHAAAGGGALALEREENAFRRLVRGLVSRTGLLVEKVALAAVCSVVVALLLLAGLSIFVTLPWGRFGLWVAALAAGRARVRRAGCGDGSARAGGARGVAAGVHGVAADRGARARAVGRRVLRPLHGGARCLGRVPVQAHARRAQVGARALRRRGRAAAAPGAPHRGVHRCSPAWRCADSP